MTLVNIIKYGFIKYGFAVFISILFVLILSLGFITKKENVDIGIVEKIELYCSDKTCKYLIQTNKGVYENTGVWLPPKFDTFEIQNQLEVGKGYIVDTTMFELRLLNMYTNIYKIKEIY